MDYDFDVIVIGAGSGGLTVSIGLANAGKRVALVEAGRIGGDCTNFGCVPSKAFIDVAKSGKFRGTQSALEEVRRRRDVFRDEESPEWIENMGIKFFAGRGSFKDKNTLLIDNKVKISAKNIIISTGSHTNHYSIQGLENKDILTNEDIFEIDEDIKDLVVIGGGYIGCELSESFANLGVKVTLIQRNSRIIPKEEPEASQVIEEVFKEKGIDIFTDAIIHKVVGNRLIIEDKNTKIIKEIPFFKILLALGRSANVMNLGLEKAGIEFSEKGISVDRFNRTKAKNVFAIGDCVEKNPMFTHWANNEGRGVIRNILVPIWKKSVRNSALPTTLYTNIEVSRVGGTESELIKSYSRDDIVSKKIFFEKNDRSKITQDEVGFVKINFKRISGKILGATIVGTKSGDMLPILVSAIDNNISAYKLSALVYSYPTKAELIKRVADQFVMGTVSNIKGEAKYFLKDNILQIITGILWLTIIAGFFYIKSKMGLTNLGVAKEIYAFVEGNKFWGPLIYICLYAIRPIIMFPATFMTFMSGALFGVWGGFIFTMIGENLSANFAYFLGRIFGKKLIKPNSSGIFANLQEKLSGNSFLPVLLTRLLFFPFDLVNYASGILKVRWKGFFLGTFIGIIPGALMVIIAGASVENASEFDLSQISINTNMLFIAFGIFIFSLGLAKILKKKGF